MNWSAASRPHPEAFWLIVLRATGRSAQRSQPKTRFVGGRHQLSHA